MSATQNVSEGGSPASDYLTLRRNLPATWRAGRADKPQMAVKTADESEGTANNKRSGNPRLPALALLCFAALWFLASCGGEQPALPADTPIPVVPTETPSPAPTTPVNPSPTPVPTPTTGPPPAATEVATFAATEESDVKMDSVDNTKVAVQQLFDTWKRALREDDAALFHSLLTRELAGSCGLDELRSWLEQDAEFLPEPVVSAVFLDVTDTTRAYAEIAAGQPAGQPQESISFPWPVALEEGKWRAGFHVAGFTANRCPFVASNPPSGPDGSEREYPQIPGLNLERREDILAAVPGTRVLHANYRTDSFGSSFSTGGSMSPYDNNVNIYAEVETESDAADLVSLYRDGLIPPSWENVAEGSSGDFGWFSWTVLDDEGRLWHGRLVVVPSHEGWKQVWLSVFSDDVGDSR